MKTPLFSQASSRDAVSICVEVRKVYSLASTSSPRPRRSRTSGLPWRTPRDCTYSRAPASVCNGVPDVAESRAVRQQNLPVRTDARQQLPFHVRPLEGAAELRDDAAA